MLKQRVLTALLLVPPLIAALFYLSSMWIAVIFGMFVAVAAWEWATLSGLQRALAKTAYVVTMLLFGALVVLSILREYSAVVSVVMAAAIWWVWVLVELLSRHDAHRGMFAVLPAKLIAGFLVLLPVWAALVYLHVTDPQRPSVLLYVLLIVWVADTAAYFAGSVFGRIKLAAHISPGKTVEGVVGGLAGVVLLAWVCGTMVWKFEGARLMLWLLLAVVTALFSVLGDLTESKLKRVAGVKDSGRIFPGHGGVLDRIDALTAAAPIFVLGLIALPNLGP